MTKKQEELGGLDEIRQALDELPFIWLPIALIHYVVAFVLCVVFVILRHIALGTLVTIRAVVVQLSNLLTWLKKLG